MIIIIEVNKNVQQKKKKQNLITLQPMPDKNPHDWSDDPILFDIFGKPIRDKYYFIKKVRIPKWLFDWLENLKIIHNNERAKVIYIRQAIYDKPIYNRIIKKLLMSGGINNLNNKEKEFLNRILLEPYY